MLNITQEQARQRLKTLPEELRDYIFNAEIPGLIERIGEKNHLDDEKQKALAKVVSYVLLGFLHQEDCRKEIQERLGINPMIANELQNILIRDVFAPISQYLEKSYSPTLKNTPAVGQAVDSVISAKPMSLDNMPKPAPMPSIPPTSFPSTQAPQIPTAPTVAGAAPASPAKISPLTFTKTPSLTPTPTETPKPMVFVTQTGGQSAPVGNVPKFKIETVGTLTGSAFGGSSAPTFGSAPRPAKIELGFSPAEKKQSPAPSFTFETQKSNVRYGAPVAPTFSSPASATPPLAPSSPNVGGITTIKKPEIPASFNVSASPSGRRDESASPAIQPASPTPAVAKQNSPTPPPAPKFEPPKPLL